MTRVIAICCFLAGMVCGWLLLDPSNADHAYATWKQLPITVWTDPGLHIDTAGIIAPWNRLAGRTILTQVASSDQANIWIIPGGSQTWVSMQADNGTMQRAIIYVGSQNDTQTLQHEEGHGLGLFDHVQASYLHRTDRQYLAGTAVCDNPNDPAYRAYHGGMSYCDWKTAAWWGAEDAAMLEHAGYRLATATPKRNPRARTARVRRTPHRTPRPH